MRVVPAGMAAAKTPFTYWALPVEGALGALGSTRDGLDSAEAAGRLARFGSGQVLALVGKYFFYRREPDQRRPRPAD